MDETQQLIREIEAFLRLTGMAESTFGRKAVNNGKLMARLRTGESSVTLATASQIRRFMTQSHSEAA